MTQDDRDQTGKDEPQPPPPTPPTRLGPQDDLLLGQIALNWKLIDQRQIDEGLREQEKARATGQDLRLGKILVDKGWLTTDDLVRVLEEQHKSLEKDLRIPRYEVRSRLGEGASAFVYRAWDAELRRHVALKVMRETTDLTGVARERFKREAQAAAQMTHPNLVAVHDAGEHEGKLYLVMELVEGRSLHEILQAARPDLKSAVELMEKVARGVAAAHARGIVHRDLKPGNILITPFGEPKVADFGLAQLPDATQILTRTGAILGTPLYMAPEQAEGRDVSTRTDVYALGAILYQLLTGRPPHQADRIADLYRMVARDDPVPPRTRVPGLPVDLETIVLKALDHDPARRYADAGGLADDLRRYLEAKPIEAQPESSARRLVKGLRRRRVGVFAGLTAVAWLLILGVGWAVNRSKESLLLRERHDALESMRETARLSVDAALRLRRAGDAEGMKRFLPSLEGAYERASRLAPGTAEADYLMGRMHRALMRDDPALDHQRRALSKEPEYAPALYERIVLQARRYDSLYRSATESLRAQELHKVMTGEGKPARAPSIEAVERSLPEILELRLSMIADCERLTQRTGISQAHALAADGILAYCQQDYERGRAKLDEALKRDPLMEEAWEALARVLEGQELSAGSAREKEELRRTAARVLTDAIARDLAYLPFHLGRGNTFMRDAVAKFRSGGDPVADLDAAEKDFAECVRIDPDHGEAWQRLGSARLDRGRYLMMRGRDPRPDWSRAEQDLGEAIRLKPGGMLAWTKRGFLHTLGGAHQWSIGADPLPAWTQGEQDLMEALKLQPLNTDPWLRLGMLRTLRGQHERDRGQDPLAHWKTAELNLSEAIRVAPGYTEALTRRAAVALHQGTWRADRREDPTADWKRCEADLAEALALEDLYVESRTLRGVLSTQRGAHSFRSGANPIPDWERAEADFRRVLGTTHAAARQGLGELRWNQAIYHDSRGEPTRAREAWLDCSRELEEAVKLNPALERTLGEKSKEARRRAG